MTGHILGFKSIQDFFSTLIIKNCTLNITFSSLAIFTTFITKYVYDDASAIYFLFFLLIVDFITGVACSIKNKSFGSARLMRIVATLITYVLVLSISWNAAKYSLWFIFLPGLVYGLMIGTQIISILENLMKLKLIKREFYNKIKNKINKTIKSF